MALDPIPEDVRVYLKTHFGVVTDEQSSRKDYYVFSVTVRGFRRELKVHRNFFMSPEGVRDYLQNVDLAGQLDGGDVEIREPLRR